MKVLVFIKEDSAETAQAKELADFLKANGDEVEILDIEDADGSSKALLYDIYSTPTFLVVREDGSLVNIWRGYVPLKSEIEHMVNN